MSEQLKKRVALLETEVANLKKALEKMPESQARPWWDERWGKFADDPGYDEAMELGREYRESLRPEGTKTTALKEESPVMPVPQAPPISQSTTAFSKS